MASQKWVCDKCSRQHESKEQAEKCEEFHPAAEDYRIINVQYEGGPHPKIPLKIRIHNLAEHPRPYDIISPSEVFTYTLERLGPRGM